MASVRSERSEPRNRERKTDMAEQTPWRKSSRSNQDSACVEIAFGSDRVAVRDSKTPAGTILVFSAEAWAAFLNGVQRGEFDARDRRRDERLNHR